MDSMDVFPVVTVGGIQYTIWNEFKKSVEPSHFQAYGPDTWNSAAYIPATVFTIPTHGLGKGDLNPEEFRAAAQSFSDDVWNEEFLQVLLVQNDRSTSIVDDRREDSSAPAGTGGHVQLTFCERTNLPNGPYLIDPRSGTIYSVARRFEDTLHAFLGGGVVSDRLTGKYRHLNTTRYMVPSRLYYEPSPSRPLQGLRFAVKDVIDIAGLKTSNGSRCWLDLYPAAEESAPFVKQLTAAGAILVGKMNCTQFCDGQDPSQRFEEISPFNPRGDGYQKPSSSSSGSAVAAAGYDWLDFTIGTDTGGSIRHPAGVNGVYGMRPSLNSVDTKGMVAQGFMDTVGFFARSAAVLDKVQKCLSTSSIHGPSSNSTTGMRYKLLYPIQPENADPSGYPKWFPRPGSSSTPEVEEGLSIFETVIKNLETHLDCQRHIFDLEELWSKTRPSDMDANLAKATGTIYQRLVYYATAHDVILPFIHDYKAANDGRSPYLEPIFKKRIQYGIAVTKEEYEEALQHFVTFKKWLHDHLFKSQPGENIVLVFPQTWGIPSYRDDTTPVPESYEPSAIFWEGFSVYSLSYISGCPDITVPVGEVCYTSRITDHEEWLPISLSFLSQPGNDSVLTSLLRDLEDKGVLRPTQTGARAYAG